VGAIPNSYPVYVSLTNAERVPMAIAVNSFRSQGQDRVTTGLMADFRAKLVTK